VSVVRIQKQSEALNILATECFTMQNISSKLVLNISEVKEHEEGSVK
jgi:rRNA maturation endonuclease Nob1